MEFFIIGLMTFFFIIIDIKLSGILEELGKLNAHKQVTNARLKIILDNEADLTTHLMHLFRLMRSCVNEEKEMVDAMKQVAEAIQEKGEE